MKILITGANGLLGSNLSLIYSNNKENVVYATGKKKLDFPCCDNRKLDLTKEEDLILIKQLKPDLIIHCAALTNIDYCEEHPEEAERINVGGTKNLFEASQKAGSYFIHISTDAVFDGEKGNYIETETTNPLNVYAKTKLDAEKYILKTGGNSAVIRTNIYGWNRQNKESLAEWMLHKLERQEKLPAIKDVYFSPILVNNLAEALLELYQIRYRGLINLAGSESCSKLDFAYKIAELFNLNKDLIEPISVDSLKFKAKRSKNMTLNTQKAQDLLKTRLFNVEEGIKKFKGLKENGYIKELKKELG